MTCKNCKFWSQTSETIGLCLRFPPTPVTRVYTDGEEVKSYTESEWAETLRDQWCSEYVTKGTSEHGS